MVALVAGFAALALIATTAGRSWVSSVITERIESRNGIAIRIGSTRLSALSRWIAFEDVQIQAAGRERPFVTAGEVQVSFAWRALLSLPLRLDRVVVRDVAVDTTMLPRDNGVSGSSSGPVPLIVDDLRWESGEIEPWNGGERFAVWFERATVSHIDGAGSLADGVLHVNEASGVLTLDHPDRPAIEVDLDLSGSVALDGTIQQATLALLGDGIQGRASLTGEDPRNFLVDGSLDARLGKLFPDLTLTGQAHVEGRVDWAGDRIRAEGDAVLSEIPARLLEPLMQGPLRRIELEQKHLEATGTLRLDLPRTPTGDRERDRQVVGLDFVTRLMRGSETLLQADLSVETADDDALPITVTWDARILPDDADRCVSNGSVHLAAWDSAAGAVLDEVVLRADVADLGAAAARFGVIDEWTGALRPIGRVAIDLRARGPILAPQLDGEASWVLDGRPILAVEADSADLAGGVRLTGTVLGAEPGRREWTTELRPDPSTGWAGARLVGGHVSIVLPDPHVAGEQFASIHQALLPQTPVPPWVDLLLWADPALGGALTLELDAEGRLSAPDIDAVLLWRPGEDESLSVEAVGRLETGAIERSELKRVDADARGLSLARLAVLLPPALAARVHGGRVDATLHASGPVNRPVANLILRGKSIDFEGFPKVSRLSVDLSADAESWTVNDFAAEWEDPNFGVLQATATIEPSYPVRRFSAHLEQTGLRGSGERAGIDLEFEDGIVHIVSGSVETETGQLGAFTGTLPLLPEFGITPLASAEGELSLLLDRVDVGAVAALWLHGEQAPVIAGTVSGSIDVDVRRLAGARGTARLDGFRFSLGEEKIETVGPLEFDYDGGTLTLRPGRLLAATSIIAGIAPLDVSGTARLDPAWRIGAPLAAALRHASAVVDGTVNASLLAPIIGATGTGPVVMHVEGSGRPGDFSIEGFARGEKARIVFTDPYPTRIENFDVQLQTQSGRIILDRLTAEVNGGHGDVEGWIDLDGAMQLDGSFRGVRYRLGFGVTTRLDAELRLDWPATGRRRLSGDVVVVRGLMDQDINLDREILRAILDPALDTGTSGRLETVDLNLSVLTDQGLIIRNNLAELRADWTGLEVRGTLADPLITGIVEVAPGGRLHLLGETLRIDEASLVWNASPPAEPVISFQTTSSNEDPTIGQSWRSGWYTTDLGPGQGGTLGFWSSATASSESALGASLAAYTQDRLYGSLGRVLTRTELNYEPLPLFGETNAEARFTVAQHLSGNLTFIASNNPRQTEGQTYILDMHEFRSMPSLRSQVFTSANDTEGVTLQQTLILGQKARAATADPLVGKRSIGVPEFVRHRPINNSVKFRKGDPFPPGAELDVEVDVAAAMRAAGYPDAVVTVEAVKADKNRVDLTVGIEPGPHVRIEFGGERRLPRSARRRIRMMYRSGEEEPRALEGMRQVAERALRSEGCLETAVTTEAIASAEGLDRVARIDCACVREADPEAPVFLGVPQDVAAWLAAGFGSRLSRIDLAAAVPEADDHLLRTLDVLGYPNAVIGGRELSEDGNRLVVSVQLGPRRFVTEVTLLNADDVTTANARGLMAIRKGDPLRHDWVSTSARALELDLRERGYDRATVRSDVILAPDDSVGASVVFNIDAGRPSAVEHIQFEGLKQSKPAWVAHVADLESGGVLRKDKIAAARGRLYRTGIFERIRVATESTETEAEEKAAGPDQLRPVAVVFQLDEAPRYQLSYGGRWDSDIGLGGVVDLVSRNTLGRGHRTGLRTILNSDLQSLRLYHYIPSPLRSERSSLELFIEGKRETIEDVSQQVVEGWAQLTFPLNQRTLTRVYGVVGTRKILSGVPDSEISLEEQVISPRFGWQLAYNTVEQGLANQRRKGFFFGIDLSGSHASLGSDLTTLGAFTQFKLYAPFGALDTGRFSWHQSYRAGTLTAQEQPLPFVDRLRAGGEFSVRGYSTNSLGPLDTDGTALGGEITFVLNQEFHARLWDSLYGVVFFDAGNVWASPEDFERNLFRSAGIGARYTSPVGPLRFDLGFPLDRRNADDKYRLYVGFGSVF